MRFSKIRSPHPVFFLLLFSSAAFAGGWQRLEPESDSSVVLQSTGVLMLEDAVYAGASLKMRQGAAGLTFEIQRPSTVYQCPAGISLPPSDEDLPQCQVTHPWVNAALGEFDVPSLGALSAGAPNPLVTHQIGASAVRVEQANQFETPVASGELREAQTPATHAVFRFEGKRWVQYDRGLLSRGIEGRIQISFKAADGSVVAQYDGTTVMEPSRRVAHGQVHSQGQVVFGSSVSGQVEGAYSLGGPLLGGGNPAQFEINLPYGTGGIRTSRAGSRLDVYPQVDVVRAPSVTSQTESRVQFEDQYSSALKMTNVDFNPSGEADPSKMGQAKGDLSYAITVSVDPYRVHVTGRSDLTAQITTLGNKQLSFSAKGVRIDSELDW